MSFTFAGKWELGDGSWAMGARGSQSESESESKSESELAEEDIRGVVAWASGVRQPQPQPLIHCVHSKCSTVAAQQQLLLL